MTRSSVLLWLFHVVMSSTETHEYFMKRKPGKFKTAPAMFSLKFCIYYSFTLAYNNFMSASCACVNTLLCPRVNVPWSLSRYMNFYRLIPARGKLYPWPYRITCLFNQCGRSRDYCINRLIHSVYGMYQCFNTLKLCFLPTQSVCMFRMVLTINSINRLGFVAET
jgi:hypothetical protein